MDKFEASEIFTYNAREKRWRLFVFAMLAGVIGGAVFLFSRDPSGGIVGSVPADVYAQISSSIRKGTMPGAFWAAFFGGLFFAFLPLEVLFVHFIKSGNFIPSLIGLYLTGLSLSCAFNYWFGLRFSSAAKIFIAPGKFYRTKGLVNRYGGAVIFFFNALPLPSQTLTVILGVFRFRVSRVAFYFVAGKVVLYSALGIYYGFISSL